MDIDIHLFTPSPVVNLYYNLEKIEKRNQIRNLSCLNRPFSKYDLTHQKYLSNGGKRYFNNSVRSGSINAKRNLI